MPRFTISAIYGRIIPPHPLPSIEKLRSLRERHFVSKETSQPPEERRAFVIRTRKIAGQLTAIERMLEEDQDCAEILAQIVSARRGLKSLAERLIHSHVEHCIEEAANPADARRKLRDLLIVLERYVE